MSLSTLERNVERILKRSYRPVSDEQLEEFTDRFHRAVVRR